MGLWLNCLFCMLLGLSLTHLIKAQVNTDSSEVDEAGGGADHEDDKLKVGDPVFYNYDVLMARKHMIVIRPGGSLQLDCKVTPPGTFKAWIKDGIVVGTESRLTIKTDDSSAFGVYHCAADPAVSQDLYKALEFAITNMPPADKTTELSVGLNRDITLTCKVNTRNNLYKWYKYNDVTFRFEEMTGQTGRQLQLPYNEMDRNRGAGFTFYICADPSNVDAFQAFKISKEPTKRLIGGRMTNVYEHVMRQIPSDVAAVPLSVTPKSKVTFECHKVNPSNNDSAKWFFRDNNTISPARYNEIGASNPGVEIQETSESSVLSIMDCDVENKGYYRCNVGGIVRYAFLDIRVIVPTIKEYGKSIYDLSNNPGAENELECEIPISRELKDVIWRIIPASGLALAPYDIPVNTRKEEFETSINESGLSKLVTIKFSDNPRLHNYRLECRLGDELDHVLLQYEQSPGISIITGGRKGILILLNCTHDDRLTKIKFHSNADRTEPTGAPLRIHASPSPTLKLYYQKADKKQMWFRCSGLDRSKGIRIYSEPVPLLKDPLPPDYKTTEFSVGLNNDIALTCKVNTRNNLYKWYKYNDLTFKFEEMTGQTGRQLQLPNNVMNKNQGAGFTFYKCADPSDEDEFQAFKISKEAAKRLIGGRMTNVYEHVMRQTPSDVAAVPISVMPKSKVTFECHKVNSSDSTKWFFRDNNTTSPARYNELRASSPGVEIQENRESSVLSVKNCGVKNKGYYRCDVGEVVKFAFLDILDTQC